MHLLMDFIPNHTSSMHKWFIESCKDDANNPYKDYYVWIESDDSINPPNNWVSFGTFRQQQQKNSIKAFRRFYTITYRQNFPFKCS